MPNQNVHDIEQIKEKLKDKAIKKSLNKAKHISGAGNHRLKAFEMILRKK